MDAPKIEAVKASDRTCTGCSRGLISQTTWYAATIEQRAEWSREGLRFSKGRGLCVSCYTGARRRNALPTPPRQDPVRLLPCRRCGIGETTGLCGDCTDVADDLDETNAWTEVQS